MKPTEHQGERVLHVDGSKYIHAGEIVGESDDGHVVYVRADNSRASTGWDFTVRKTILTPLLQNAKKALESR